VTPLPFEPGGPPIWVGGLSQPALRRAGELADGVMATEVTPEELRAAVQQAREGAAACGRDPAQLAIALHLPTLVTEAPAPWSRVRTLLSYPGWKYDDMDSARGSVGPLRHPAPLSAAAEARLRETSVTGTPSEVSDRIQEYAEAAGGALHFVARSYLPGQDHESRLAALDGLAEVRRLLPSDPS
jgi:alkanesulfonate monooxygenase SsuD/methylene tetrahydromethanopterin reductase-like flavin-dependent oxidoreductase (luciferase family)